MPLVTLTTGTLHYTDHGQGTPLILLHANPGDSKDFDAVIPELAVNYRVIAVDWPGYGESEYPKELECVDVLYYYEVLKEFMEALAIPPAILIGNSLGGNAAARLAAKHPNLVKGLVLIAPGGFTQRNFFTALFCHLQASRLSLTPYHFAYFYLKQKSVGAKAMLRRAAAYQSQSPQLQLNRTIWKGFNQSTNDIRELSKSIATPALLVLGKKDPVIRANKDGKTAKECMPHAKFVVLPCGHAPFAEMPEQFLNEVLPFLNDC